MWSIEHRRPARIVRPARPVMARPPAAHDALEDARNVEYGAIADVGNAGAKFFEPIGDLGNAAANRPERSQDDSRLVFLDPIGVVALLRHGPGVAHDDHGQPLLNGL